MTICPNCHKEYKPVLGERKTDKLIQREFPKAEAWQREQLITGICSDTCWKEFLGVNTDLELNSNSELLAIKNMIAAQSLEAQERITAISIILRELLRSKSREEVELAFTYIMAELVQNDNPF